MQCYLTSVDYFDINRPFVSQKLHLCSLCIFEKKILTFVNYFEHWTICQSNTSFVFIVIFLLSESQLNMYADPVKVLISLFHCNHSLTLVSFHVFYSLLLLLIPHCHKCIHNCRQIKTSYKCIVFTLICVTPKY